ncbi:hypothetical protein [Youxingia wuxianensis]|uniref:Uncharacterized protein n=1 Tax=Youxingia wuxianensis TaxID=2763678 RepID=A0A926EMK0_9FIRM|nr:hypothetical protein [Youxingia wuxianensis]MBC8586233.1 hypothetical protein [Youxingia wuxianensis]
MKGFFCLLLSALLLMTTGCSGNSDNANEGHNQNGHLLSVNVKVVEIVENNDKLFKVEALENCTEKIAQGDTILVTADSADISSILESYQQNNSFRIYFPVITDTAEGVSVTCFDIIQYDSTGKIVQKFE